MEGGVVHWSVVYVRSIDSLKRLCGVYCSFFSAAFLSTIIPILFYSTLLNSFL